MARKSPTSTLARLPKDLFSRRGRLAKHKAEQARREYNVWAWEQNREGRQARLGAA